MPDLDSINWEEVAATAGIALAVVVLALAVPMLRDYLGARAAPHSEA